MRPMTSLPTRGRAPYPSWNAVATSITSGTNDRIDRPRALSPRIVARGRRMIATRVVRTLDVSAASGLVLRDGSFHVVADDENALFVFGPDGATRRIALLQGELPAKHSERKGL